MRDLSEVDIQIQNYRSIGEEPQGFSGLTRFTLIVGRNNSGKSSLIDAIKYAIEPRSSLEPTREGKVGSVVITQKIEQGPINSTFSNSTSGGDIRFDGTHREYGERWVNKRISYSLGNEPNNNRLRSVETLDDGEQMIDSYAQTVIKNTQNPFRGMLFRKLLADRNIVPESTTNSPQLAEDGQGATSLLEACLVEDDLNLRSYVKDKFLKALNDIFNPEIYFKDISSTRKNKLNEITLQNSLGQDIRLSNSGSGLRTVILILLNILIIPKIETRDVSDYIFAFEEIENNLHPGIQRKLAQYLTDFSINNGVHIILTTHSNVILDHFSKTDETKILYVKKPVNLFSQVSELSNYLTNKEVLDDLDFRASDLLMSNGIVWLEGPSDKVYFNTWIKLWSDNKLVDGVHYQCVFYGGSVLSNLTASGDKVEENKIDVLRVNSNAIIIFDSDKNSEDEAPDRNKKEKNKIVLSKAISDAGGYSWFTLGREVENYIPYKAMLKKHGDQLKQPIGQYEDIKNYLNKLAGKQGNTFESNKKGYAIDVVKHLNVEMLETHLDMKKRMNEVCSIICQWNGLEENKFTK